MENNSLNKINQNIMATEDLIEKYENKKEEVKLASVPGWQIYSCEIAGGISTMAILSMNTLDLGALTLGCFGGLVLGASVPYIIKQIKIGELNYQIFMNGLIMEDLEKEKNRVSEKVKKLYK